MSWYFQSIGSKPNVIAELMQQEAMPEKLREAVKETIDGISDEYGDIVQVDTCGHSGGGFSSIGKLEVFYFRSAKAPESVAAPVAAPEPPATAAQVAESMKSTTTQA